MSYEYDQYLKEHIANVKKGLEWMQENLDIHNDDINNAIYEADQHDRSKWGVPEYNDYDAYFYGGNRSYQVVQNFKYAWLHHQHRNPHHWQYWVLVNDDPNDISTVPVYNQSIALAMPMRYIYEMIADWWAFSWKSGNLTEIFSWYEAHQETILLHKMTRIIVEDILQRMAKKLEYYSALEEEAYISDLQHGELSDEEVEKRKYAFPEERKFPMPDADHVKSAIRFFNYVDPDKEELLAKAILARKKEYGLTSDDISVGDENRFKKYIPEKEKE